MTDERSFTKAEIEKAFLKWWELSKGFPDFDHHGRPFDELARGDADYLVELMNDEG